MYNTVLIHNSFDLEKTPFFSNGKTDNTVQHELLHNEFVLNAKQDIDFSEMNSKINTLIKAEESYHSLFSKLQELQLKLGFKDYGLEGQWRDEIHSLENKISSSNYELLAAYLMLRRYEKDYLLRGDNEATLKWKKSLLNLKRLKSNSQEFLNLINNYEQIFLNYTEINDSRNKTEILLKNSYSLLKKITNEIHVDREKDLLIINRQSFYFGIIFPIFLVLVTLSLIYQMTLNLTKPLIDIQKHATKAAEGDFTKELDVTRIDEFGKLKTAINEMIRALRLINQRERMILIGEVTAEIIHDIRSPLTIINGSLPILKSVRTKMDNNDQSKLLEKCLNMIEKATHRIIKITNSVQALSKNNQDEELKPILLKELLEDSIFFIETKLQSHNISLTVSEYSDALVVYNRGIQLSQVIINLLNNSIESIQKLQNPWIQLNITENSDYVFLSIVDSGSGIPISIKNKLFSEAVSTKPGKTGTGIGLKMCKKILDRHNAKIEIIDGTNTEFRISFPKIIAGSFNKNE
jgi:signal transduction histidine kinase